MSMFTWPVTQKPRAVCILHSTLANLFLEGLLNFQGERHVVEHCIWLPVRISEEEEGKLKEASLKTLISDDISNSGRTTVPFFRTPWVNPGQLSKPLSIPFSPLLTNLCTAKGTIQKKFPTRESYIRYLPYLLVQLRDFSRYGNEYKMSRYLLASMRAQ